MCLGCTGRATRRRRFGSAREKSSLGVCESNKSKRRRHFALPAHSKLFSCRYDHIPAINYFHDADSTTEFDIKSVTKSVVSALAGIAQAKGLLSDLNTPVVKLFPEFAQPPNFPLQCTYTRFHHDEYNIVQV